MVASRLSFGINFVVQGWRRIVIEGGGKLLLEGKETIALTVDTRCLTAGVNQHVFSSLLVSLNLLSREETRRFESRLSLALAQSVTASLRLQVNHNPML